MDLVSALKKAGFRHVTGEKKIIDELSRDKSPIVGSTPLAIVWPSGTAQISKLMRLCDSGKIGVTVRGAGSALTGSSVPIGKSIILDMRHLGSILEINIHDKYVVVEPGVILGDLNRKLAKYGYFYPPDPGSSGFATIGGTISTNAGGLRAVRYGTTKDWLLGLEVVLPNGKVIKTGGRVLKRSIGYDLTGLFVASEGTLGVITKAILKICPMPEKVALVVGYYKRISDAGKVIAELNGKGVELLAAEFLDREAMGIMAGGKRLKLPDNAEYMLFVEIGTSAESLSRISAEVQHAFRKYGASGIEVAASKEKIERLYAARKNIFTVMKKSADIAKKSLMIADSVVPISELPDSLVEMEKVRKRHSLQVVLFGHIGDGNIHANIVYDKSEAGEVAEMDEIQEEFARIAIKHGGSVSGEHGIGIAKKALLKEEFAARGTLESLVLMKKIKSVFDPNGILNRGKIFD